MPCGMGIDWVKRVKEARDAYLALSVPTPPPPIPRVKRPRYEAWRRRLQLIMLVRLLQRRARTLRPPPQPRRSRQRYTTGLLKTDAWRAMRERVFIRDGRVCRACGATKHLNVDHILPKSEYPFLAFDINNLQVLCWPCNKAKGAKL